MQKQQKVPREFSYFEWREITSSLEDFHALFQKLWEMGKPKFTYDLPTAAVYFDKLGDCIDFNINPDFWDTLEKEQKLFVVCHEILHVFFCHGYRINGLKQKFELQIANLALDIVVNHFLTDSLGFDRNEVDPPIPPEALSEEERKLAPEGYPKGKYCWVDTVFPEEKSRPFTGESFEYYYNLVKKEVEKDPNGKVGKMSSLDGHDGLSSFAGEAFDKKMKDSLSSDEQKALDNSKNIKNEAKKELDAEAKRAKEGGKKAGNEVGSSWILAKNVKVPPKRRWESVIKNWSSKYLNEKLGYQWVHENRRMSELPKSIMLPSEYEIDEYEKARIPVWFFLDTSGSCAHLADRFFQAAKSLPEDKFLLKLFCFDTKVYETSLESKKLYGFGGTQFDIIEHYIQKEIKSKNTKYPEAVFIVTDGMGNNVQPEKPHRWQWFLSEDYRSCIPKECKIHKLSDYE